MNRLARIVLSAIGVIAVAPIFLLLITLGHLFVSEITDGPVYAVEVENPKIKISVRFRHSCENIRRDYRCLKFEGREGFERKFEMFPNWGPELPIAIYEHDGLIRVVDCISFFDFDLKGSSQVERKISDITGRERHLATFEDQAPGGPRFSKSETRSIGALATARDCRKN